MSVMMTRRGGWVQLEQSDIHLLLNMAKMAKGGFSCAAMEDAQLLMKKHRTKVQDKNMWGVEVHGQTREKAVMVRHPAMLCEDQTDG